MLTQEEQIKELRKHNYKVRQIKTLANYFYNAALNRPKGYLDNHNHQIEIMKMTLKYAPSDMCYPMETAMELFAAAKLYTELYLNPLLEKIDVRYAEEVGNV